MVCHEVFKVTNTDHIIPLNINFETRHKSYLLSVMRQRWQALLKFKIGKRSSRLFSFLSGVGGGGGYSLILGLDRYVRRQTVWFQSRYGLKYSEIGYRVFTSLV